MPMRRAFAPTERERFGALAFLGHFLAHEARFYPRGLRSSPAPAEIEGRYNVIHGSAIMCHLPDPLNLNAYLGSLAQDALFSSARSSIWKRGSFVTI